MKSLFTPDGNAEIIDRINKLTPSTPQVWGKMNVSQMLAHCQQPLKVAFGEVKMKQGLMGILFGKMMKKKLTGTQPFQKNLPTAKPFIIANPGEFELEKTKLIALVKKFYSEGPNALSKDPHPFFGRLTDEEWDKLSWKHLDHHLQQFGV